MSSKLPETFDDLRKHLEWSEQIIADVRQATIYPAIVIVVIGAFTFLLFGFVIPRFAHLLESLKVPQPLLTRIVFGLGDVVQATWWITVPVLLLLVLVLLLAGGCRRASDCCWITSNFASPFSAASTTCWRFPGSRTIWPSSTARVCPF